MKTFRLAGIRSDRGIGAITATVQAEDGEVFAIEMPVDLLNHYGFLYGNFPADLPSMGVQGHTAELTETDRPDDGA